MTDSNTDGGTNQQRSVNGQHKQCSLHPADPNILMDSVSGKGYSQRRIDPTGQASLSTEPSGAPVPGNFSGEQEDSKGDGHRVIIPVIIAFALGLLVALLIFRTIYVPSSGTNDNILASTEAEGVQAVLSDENDSEQEDEQSEDIPEEEYSAEGEQSLNPDAVVEIPDPALKKIIQDALGIGNREITEADALSLTTLVYDDSEQQQLKDITGLSAFENLTVLNLLL